MDDHLFLNGVKIVYTLSGSGPPIVLLHGWMCNRRFWSNQVSFFSKTCRVLAPDFRGHGDSSVPREGYHLKNLAEDIHQLIERLDLSPVTLIGHSMGGMVAQQFAVNHKRSLSCLVLVTTIAADPENHLISKRIEAETPHLGFRKAFLKSVDGWFGQKTSPDIRDWVKEEMLKTPEKVALPLVRSYRRFDLRNSLSCLSIPVLVMGGGQDVSAVPHESRILAGTIPGAQLVMLNGVGHFPMIENPKTFNKVLQKCLEKITDKKGG
jgi:pimeloyl-ACP methyl ester carboxylesterase